MIGKLLCSIGLHKWSKWGKPYQVRVYSHRWYQGHECTRCHILKSREVYNLKEDL